MNRTANGLLLVLMGVPYTLTLGVLTGLLYAVPFIGPIAAVALVGVRTPIVPSGLHRSLLARLLPRG